MARVGRSALSNTRMYGWATDHLPLRLVNWWWPTFCTHHDQPANRWHRRRCKHRYLVLTDDDIEWTGP